MSSLPGSIMFNNLFQYATYITVFERLRDHRISFLKKLVMNAWVRGEQDKGRSPIRMKTVDDLAEEIDGACSSPEHIDIEKQQGGGATNNLLDPGQGASLFLDGCHLISCAGEHMNKDGAQVRVIFNKNDRWAIRVTPCRLLIHISRW